jgi:hypothetical protein
MNNVKLEDTFRFRETYAIGKAKAHARLAERTLAERGRTCS